MDDSFGAIRDIRHLSRDFGWHKGDFFESWIGDLIEERLGNRRATLGDLAAAGLPELYVIGTNLSTGYAEVFPAERHANMELAIAVRISMSIPLFFSVMRYGEREDVYVDGGVQLNYPIKLFDRERYIDKAYGTISQAGRHVLRQLITINYLTNLIQSRLSGIDHVFYLVGDNSQSFGRSVLYCSPCLSQTYRCHFQSYHSG